MEKSEYKELTSNTREMLLLRLCLRCMFIDSLSLLFAFAIALIPKLTWNMCVEIQYFRAQKKFFLNLNSPLRLLSCCPYFACVCEHRRRKKLRLLTSMLSDEGCFHINEMITKKLSRELLEAMRETFFRKALSKVFKLNGEVYED
jgi:hypothetical protein